MRDVIPLYFRIFLVLEQKIRSGFWPAGGGLPSEQELAAEFEVSRVTIRNTMALLEEADLITRHRGRGTFVNPNLKIAGKDDGTTGLKQNIREFEETTEVELHEFAEVEMSASMAEECGGPVGEQALRIRRTRRKPGEKAFSHSIAYVLPPESYLLSAESLGNRTVIAALEQRGFDFAHAEQRLTAVAAAPDLAEHLGVEEGSPLICLKRWVYDRHERLVEYIRIFYDPQMFEYRVGLSRESEGASPPQWVQKE